MVALSLTRPEIRRVVGILINELIKIAGGSQLDDHVFPRAGFCAMRLWQEYLVQGWQRTPFSSRSNCRIYCVAFLPRGIFPAFVPIPAEYKSKQGEDATRVFVAYVSGLLTLAPAIVTVLGMLAAPRVIMVTAPGFADSADKFALTTQLLRITFPYILLISLASLVGAILNTEPFFRSGLCANFP